jgi:hexulose-6-phosphate isomerase
MTMIKSISYWSFPGGMKLKDRMKLAKAVGFEAIELTLEGPDAEINMKTTAAEIKAIKQMADKIGLQTPTFATGLYWSEPMVLDGGKINKTGLDICKKALQLAKAIGATTALTIPCTVTPGLPYDVAWEKSLEVIKKMVPEAEKTGVTIGIEYVWNKFLLSPLEFAHFCDEVGSTRVGLFFDTGNMVIFGFPQHWVRICARHLMKVHFKDFRRNGYEWTPLMQGDVNFTAVMAELRKAGYDGALLSEVDPSIASLAETAATIRQIMAM